MVPAGEGRRHQGGLSWEASREGGLGDKFSAPGANFGIGARVECDATQGWRERPKQPIYLR